MALATSSGTYVNGKKAFVAMAKKRTKYNRLGTRNARQLGQNHYIRSISTMSIDFDFYSPSAEV